MESLPEKTQSKDDMYNKRKKHWESKDATMKSVLGGWEDTHLLDVKCSNELLAGLIYSKQLNPKRALDCGAGIGRVTEYVEYPSINSSLLLYSVRLILSFFH